MLPDQWLKNTQIIKLRNRLSGWSRQDFVNFAVQELGKVELSKQELAQLIVKLKAPGLARPIVSTELSEEITPEGSLPVEFRMVANPGNTDYKLTHWYLAGKRAELRFNSHQEVTRWALSLILKDTSRNNWQVLLKEWAFNTQLKRFDAELYPVHNLDPVLRKVLSKQAKQVSKLLRPLPSNADILKRYWSLEEGDLLMEGLNRWRVAKVRINMDGPPTLVLEKLNDQKAEPV